MSGYTVYTDAAQIIEYETTAMQRANVEGQITSQTNSTIAPQDTVIRAKVTTILMYVYWNIAG